MPDGYLLDLYPDPVRREMVLWLKRLDDGPAVRIAEPFTPVIYARGRSREALRELARALTLVRGVGETEHEERVCGLDREPSPVLRIPVLDHGLVQRVAQMADARGNYRDYELYNADLRMSHRYLIATGLWPLVKMRAWKAGRYRILEPGDKWSVDYEAPPLTQLEIAAEARVQRGELATKEARLRKVRVGDVEHESSDEAEMLSWLAAEVRDRDPDIILTRGGDTFLLPYLHARAAEAGVDFWLGRERDPTKPRKQGKSYFSYGKIKYQAPAYALHGRIHIDKTTSFFHEEAGMQGILDLARVSNVPLQDIARLGAGTALTAIQIDLAASQGRLIPWKKNVPEAFKSAYDLLQADRGGYIFEPRVGLHEDVVEYDFASLYPNIMVNHNISPESINCPCCSLDSVPPENATPQLGTWTCARGEAFIPAYLRPVVARREHYKKMRKRDPANRALYQQVCDVYKWLLVCSFGYQGYKNAKFGRIECHEAISAWGRETLLSATEIARDEGFELLHGIVDSLWIKRLGGGGSGGNAPRRGAPPSVPDDIIKLGDSISRELKIPCEYQGRYKWIVFLPTRSSVQFTRAYAGGNPYTGFSPDPLPQVGALNRYYGCLDAKPDKPSRSQAGQPLDYIAGGALKVRGVELRQHSTPRVIREAQEEFLKVVAEANDAREFMAALPRAIDAAKPVWRRVMDGRCKLEDLVFVNSVGQDASEYRTMTCAAAALKQLAAKGLVVQPGDTVRYVILDESSRAPHEKVVETRLMRGDEAYDRAAYERVLLRAVASLTLPFHVYEDDIAMRYSGKAQVALSAFG